MDFIGYKSFNKKFLFSLNLVILFANIFLIFFHLYRNKNLNQIFFKNSDFFNMNLCQKAYQYISAYLLNKYIINNYTNSIEKKVIKLKATGLFNRKFNLQWLKARLSDQFILQYDDPNPDYLLYNCFNNEDTNKSYHNIIRIAVYTENIIPDINYADYFIVHYHIIYLDRFFKSNVFFWMNFNEIDSKRLEVMNSPIRKKFCAAVISNCNAKFRLNFINKLNHYKKVDMGGNCNNNVHGKIKIKLNFYLNINFHLLWKIVMEMDIYLKKLLNHFLQELYLYIMEIIWLMNI